MASQKQTENAASSSAREDKAKLDKETRRIINARVSSTFGNAEEMKALDPVTQNFIQNCYVGNLTGKWLSILSLPVVGSLIWRKRARLGSLAVPSFLVGAAYTLRKKEEFQDELMRCSEKLLALQTPYAEKLRIEVLARGVQRPTSLDEERRSLMDEMRSAANQQQQQGQKVDQDRSQQQQRWDKAEQSRSQQQQRNNENLILLDTDDSYSSTTSSEAAAASDRNKSDRGWEKAGGRWAGRKGGLEEELPELLDELPPLDGLFEEDNDSTHADMELQEQDGKNKNVDVGAPQRRSRRRGSRGWADAPEMQKRSWEDIRQNSGGGNKLQEEDASSRNRWGGGSWQQVREERRW
eukprot:gb/GEZN01009093.1/.p1 GENE.gb/GEZN01009093.1/~~gb/GEZN01009093.1/.p1  ORF type:complete len:352 (-),score=68.46 gb/GEZN01009093.1/:241-1296(-)